MKSFCVFGLGRFGQTLALSLAKSGHQVLIIDEDSDAVNALADAVTSAVVGDPTSEKVLRAAGVLDYDCAIVCTASNINDNILLTIMLKDLGMPKIVARALNEGHKRVLQRLGVDMIAFPEEDTAEKLAYMLGHDNVIESLDFASGYRIVDEGLCEAAGKLYTCILAEYDGVAREFSATEYLLGECNIRNAEPLECGSA